LLHFLVIRYIMLFRTSRNLWSLRIFLFLIEWCISRSSLVRSRFINRHRSRRKWRQFIKLYFAILVLPVVSLSFSFSIYVYIYMRVPRLLLSRTRRPPETGERPQWSCNEAHIRHARASGRRLRWASESEARIRDDRRIFRATCYAPRFNSGFEGFLPARASNDTPLETRNIILRWNSYYLYMNTMHWNE